MKNRKVRTLVKFEKKKSKKIKKYLKVFPKLAYSKISAFNC